MRHFINIIESISSSALFINAANEILTRDFANRVVCDLSPSWDSETSVEIEHIAAIEIKQGWGTKAMMALCSLADEMSITLTLGVANETDDAYTGDDLPSEDDLISFYAGFGFEQNNSWGERVEMTRTPDFS